jgi:2-methylcitrate dehydratase PrpD
MIKGVAVGLVLERALEAAELARLGVTATEDALETAFSRLLPDGPTGVVESRLKQLGSRWTTTRNLIKVYPAQLYTQPAIEAALGLYQNGIRADRVRKLILYATETFAPASRVRRKRLHPQVGRLRITVPLT